MAPKTVLVTGTTGFIGRHLRKTMENEWPDAIIVGLSRTGGADIGPHLIADLLDSNAVIGLLESLRPDCVFHLAGTIYSKNWNDLYQQNVLATINLLDGLARSCPGARVVIAGSAAEYGWVMAKDLPISEGQALNPVSPYGVSKVWQTVVARSRGLSSDIDVIIGRIFNIIGPGAPEGSCLGTFVRQLQDIRQGDVPPTIKVGNLKSRRDFLDIKDISKAFIALAKRGKRGETYNICSGRSETMETLLNAMVAQTGHQVDIIVDEERLRHVDVPDIYGSHEKLTTDTGWVPQCSVEDSVRALLPCISR